MKNIILTGFMGTGKSSVGKVLAERLSYRYVDTDTLIEEKTGLSISEIFERFGERYFRDIERDIIKSLSSKKELIISIGGGAIVDPENLSLLRKKGLIICLKASPDEIVSRVKEDDTRPLILGNGRLKTIERLLREREKYYSRAHLSIDTSDRRIEEVAEEILEQAVKYSVKENKPFDKTTVSLGERSYPIYFTRGGLKRIGEVLKKLRLYKRIALITNPLIKGLYGDIVESSLEAAGFEPHVIEIPDGERYKTLKWVSKTYDILLSLKMDRYAPIIALGGGVIGDITGFVAATYLRGVPYIQIPTTLLAQVDSSVGGKTGVNHLMGKNLIGAFYQPRLVFIDVEVLKTLKARDLKAGLAEVVKYGIIRDESLFSLLENNTQRFLNMDSQSLIKIIKRSCQIKARIVERDERERGLRSILNLGHTFGHAIELLTNYKRFRHGEAVALGMVMAARLSYRLELCGSDVPKRIERLLSKIGLPTNLSISQGQGVPVISKDQFIKAMEIDKKVKGGKVRLILIEEIGKVVTREMEWRDFSLDLSSVLN